MSQQVSGSTQLMALHDALRVRGIVDTGFRMPVLEKKRIAVLGATGSIGTSCIDVVRHQLDAFEIERQARAMQARAMADMVKSLLRSISARLHRNAAAHTA